MSQHIIIAASESLVGEIVSRFPGGANDFGAMMVVFPGKRPAHFVRRALAELTKGSFIPPRIFSIDSFIDHLVTERLNIRQRALENFDAVALLFEIHRALPSPLGGEHFHTLDRFLPLGLKLYGELEELVMADAEPRRIREAMSTVPLGRVQALPDYFNRFYDALRERNLTTRSLQYRAAAESIDHLDLSDQKEIILAGFYAYTQLEQRAFRALLRRDNVTFIAQQGPGLQKQLSTIGIDARPPETAGERHAPAFRFSVSPDTHGQVFAVTEQIQTMMESNKPVNERTVIVLPTADALFPVVHHTLPLLPSDGYNIALGYPLQRTPLFGFLMSLMSLAGNARNGKVAASDYAAFILHPYTKNILFRQRADVTRMLFHAVESFLAGHQSNMLLGLEMLEGENRLFEGVSQKLATGGIDAGISDLKAHLLLIHDQTIRKLLRPDSVGGFAEKITEVVQYIHKHSTATRHPLFRQYAERFLQLFDALRSSLLAPHSFADPSAYGAFLRHAVSAEEVPFPGTPLRGLQVLGLLETRGLSFDTVFLLNATDDVIPGGRSHDLLLPQPLREKLGLETSRDRERLVEYYFNTLLAGAREVHCYYTESGNHEKSRYLEKLLWGEQKKNSNPDASALVQVVRYNVQLSTSRPGSVQKKPAVIEHLRQFEFTATALDTYLTCPLRFYYAHILRLLEKDEVVDEVDQREIGTLVHRVLKAYFDPAIGRPLAEADLSFDRMKEIIDRHFHEAYGHDLIGSAFLVKQQFLRQLGAFLTGYQIPKASTESIIVSELEKEYSASVEHYRFTGRIDRVERRGARHVILDYKIGRNDQRVRINLAHLDADDRSTWSTAIGSFQLAMYMLLYAHATKVSPEAIEPAYLFLGRNEIDLTIETPIGAGRTPAADVYRSIQPVMLKLVDEILDPSIEFKPADRLEEACPGCPYRPLCGTTWIEGGMS
ncbi:MAG TPA: hypothetical protein DEP53_04360 [Bacteroidetes bacterium]|nr:hypothetical protein [Bacteroidota bacterium]